MKTRIYIFSISCMIFFSCSYNKRQRFERQIGTYILDTSRSSFDSSSLNADDFKNLTVTFYPDSTFIFSRSVPFIWDSSGTWYVDANDDLYNLAYLSYTLQKNSSNVTSQFYSYDSTVSKYMKMNSTTPQSNEYFIQELYFIKIDSLNPASKEIPK